MREALRGRRRMPNVASEFPLVVGADLSAVEDAKTTLLHYLEITLGVRKPPAPVEHMSRNGQYTDVHI